MPRVQIHERCHKVESEGRGKSEEDNSGTTPREEAAGKFSCSVLEIYRRRFAPRQEGGDDEIHCQDDEIELDKAEDDEGGYICPFRAGLRSAESCCGGQGMCIPFGSITQCKNELEKYECQIQVFQSSIKAWCDSIPERPGTPWIDGLIRCSDQVHDNRRRKPISRYLESARVSREY